MLHQPNSFSLFSTPKKRKEKQKSTFKQFWIRAFQILMMIFLCDASVTGSMTASFTYHVAVELSGGVAAVAGAIGLGDGLRRAGLDQTSPVNQTDKEESQTITFWGNQNQ